VGIITRKDIGRIHHHGHGNVTDNDQGYIDDPVGEYKPPADEAKSGLIANEEVSTVPYVSLHDLHDSKA
jgi:hypothetical protein